MHKHACIMKFHKPLVTEWLRTDQGVALVGTTWSLPYAHRGRSRLSKNKGGGRWEHDKYGAQ